MQRPSGQDGDGSNGRDTDPASEPAQALRAGDDAPDFRLPDQHGRFVTLSDALRTRPAVLCFLGSDRKVRSDPQLAALESWSAEIIRQGGSIIVVSPRPQTCIEAEHQASMRPR